jgi:hypothetical protein
MRLPKEAQGITAGPCDCCPAVHVNLHDASGKVFATASVPLENCDGFVTQFRLAQAELANRFPAPAMKQ